MQGASQASSTQHVRVVPSMQGPLQGLKEEDLQRAKTPAACDGSPQQGADPLPLPGRGHRQPHDRAGQGMAGKAPPGKAGKGQQGSTDGDAGEASTSP